MFYNAKTKTLKIDDTSIDYAVFGSGTKPLIIIPGLSLKRVKGAAFPLALMYRIFTKKYKVYVFDKKEEIPAGYTIQDLAEDLAAAMRALHLEHAHVMGVSQGGMIAQYLAYNHPESVDKLVLAVTASRMNDTLEQVVNRWITMAENRDHKSLIRDSIEFVYSDAYVKRYRWAIPLLYCAGKYVDIERFGHLAQACLTCDIYDKLTEISCPVFVIGGKRDKIVTKQAAVEIYEQLLCEWYLYENGGHSVYEEEKDFNQRVYEFLQS